MNAGEDARTLAFYEDEAPVYATHGEQCASRHLSDFLGALPADARILELGCGAGCDSVAMLAQGFDIDATDGCAALAEKAETRIGRRVRVMRFAELDAEAKYDGVWANASLLHVPRADLAGILARIHRALVAGGVFTASYKAGGAEGRDRFGRYFNYPDAAWLRRAYEEGGAWAGLDIATTEGGGYDGVTVAWLRVTAIKASGRSPAAHRDGDQS